MTEETRFTGHTGETLFLEPLGATLFIAPLEGGNHSARSNAQLANIVSQKLDSIWRMGDRDECSIKHIGHATAALAAGQHWTNGIDYPSPWSSVDVPPRGAEDRLDEKWASVVNMRNDIGTVRFDEVMRETKFSHYHSQNLKLHWGDLPTDVDLATLVIQSRSAGVEVDAQHAMGLVTHTEAPEDAQALEKLWLEQISRIPESARATKADIPDGWTEAFRLASS